MDRRGIFGASRNLVLTLFVMVILVSFLVSTYFINENSADGSKKSAAGFASITGFVTVGTSFTVYIDPSYDGSNGPSDGSLDAPYTAWTNFTIQSGGAYLQKRGTTYTSSSKILLYQVNNASVADYGSGEKPIFNYTGSQHNYSVQFNLCTDCSIENIRVTAPSSSGLIAIIGMGSNTGGFSGGTRISVIGCEVWKAGSDSSGAMGIRGGGNSIKILNTTVHDISTDGIYAADAPNIEIGYSNIYDMNRMYFSNPNEATSSGDGIQFGGNYDGFHIHHTIINRTNGASNKFNLILASAGASINATGILEYNTFVNDGSVAWAVHIEHGRGIVTRYNTFRGSTLGLRLGGAGTSNNLIHNNIFYDSVDGIRVGYTYSSLYHPVGPAVGTQIFNNVFYNVSQYHMTVDQATVEARNNIHLRPSGVSTGVALHNFGGGSWTLSNNCYGDNSTAGTPGTGTNPVIGDPLFVNVAAKDFSLQSGSLCIDAGVDVDVLFDREGVSIPQGSAPDIGAYEYVPSLSESNIIYVDPTFVGVESGTITNPFNSWTDFVMQNNMVYLQKRGTVYTSSTTISINDLSNISLGAYDVGAKPKFMYTGASNAVKFHKTNFVSLNNWEIEGNSNAVSLVRVNGTQSLLGVDSNNNSIINCTLHEAHASGSNGFGVVGWFTTGLKVLGTSISNVGLDGMYLHHTPNAEIGFCNITLINMKSLIDPDPGQDVASGDGIHFNSDYDGFYVHDNIIDRDDGTEYKFCLIFHDSSKVYGHLATGSIERNTFIARDPNIYSNVYIVNGDDFLIKDNKFVGGFEGLWLNGGQCNNMRVYNNIFEGLSKGVGTHTDEYGYPSGTEVYNNVFYGMGSNHIEIRTGHIIDVKNNIHMRQADSALAYVGSGSWSLSNNLFSVSGMSGTPGVGNNSVIGNPLFVDAVNGDFNLQSGSPAINAGIDVGILFDHEGVSIPQGSAPDIGAYEYAQDNSSEEYGNLTVGASTGGIVNGSTTNFVVPASKSIIAYASSGYNFSNWTKTSGDCSINNHTLNSTTVLVTSGICIVQANFIIDDLGLDNESNQSNNAPNISNQEFYVEENKEEGYLIGTVVATDSDMDQTLTYLIIAGNTDNVFTLAQLSGQLQVNTSSALDFETNEAFSLLIEVQDDGDPVLSSNATVMIYVEDVDEDEDGGGGGNSGGNRPPKAPEKNESSYSEGVWFFSLIENESIVTLVPHDLNTRISEISFTSLKKFTDVSIELDLVSSTEEYGDYLGVEFKEVFVISSDLINADNIKSTKINFKVRKSELAINESSDNVALYFYDEDGWREIGAELSGEDNLNYYFISTTPIYGIFAIGLKSAQVMEQINSPALIESVDLGVDETSKLTANLNTSNKKISDKILRNILLGVGLVVLISIAVFSIKVKNKKKASMNKNIVDKNAENIEVINKEASGKNKLDKKAKNEASIKKREEKDLNSPYYKEVLEYVEHRLNSGEPIDSLYEKIVKVGWTVEDARAIIDYFKNNKSRKR
ncbi:MAG: choice-of-anchor Q domain-containing protein [Candidatus Nanoarchaeia archaeon]